MEKFKNIVKDAKTRIFTALGLIGFLCLLVAVDSALLTWAFLGLLYLIAFHETCKLIGVKDTRLYMLAIALWLFCGWFEEPIFVVCIALILLTSYMLQTQNFDVKKLMPFIYPTIPMVLFLTLYMYYGMPSLVWLVLIIAPTDIGAYVVGKAMGKTPFCAISPNKTWEGVIGGIAFGTVIGSIIGNIELNFWTSLAISLAVSASSVWGDLFESYLKREAGVKDSGKVFPGHGGVLDRVDGYFFGSIVMLTLLSGLL